MVLINASSARRSIVPLGQRARKAATCSGIQRRCGIDLGSATRSDLGEGVARQERRRLVGRPAAHRRQRLPPQPPRMRRADLRHHRLDVVGGHLAEHPVPVLLGEPLDLDAPLALHGRLQGEEAGAGEIGGGDGCARCPWRLCPAPTGPCSRSRALRYSCVKASEPIGLRSRMRGPPGRRA